MPNPSLVRRHKGLAIHTAHQLLHVDAVRFAVAWLRYTWFARLRRQLRTLDPGSGVASNTVGHNLKGLTDLAVVRSLHLLRPVSVLECLAPDADVLSIGPRTEGELLALVAHGFDRRRVRAVDLLSYSPWVDLGDMHALPYDDDSFDCIVAGWVLAYSDSKEIAASEMVRVARPGAVLAIGVEWSALSNDELRADHGYVPGSEQRLRSTEEILALFDGAVGEVVFRQDPSLDGPATQSIVVVFRLPEVSSVPGR